MKCKELAVKSDDLRSIAPFHHVVIDEGITSRVHQCNNSSQLFCNKSECNNIWGVLERHKEVLFAVLMIDSFILVDAYNRRSTCKKWKYLPFKILPIDESDMERRFTWKTQSEQDEV